MLKKQRRVIKSGIFILFFGLIAVFNQLVHPHFIIAGIIYLEGAWAVFLNIILIAAIIIAMHSVATRRWKTIAATRTALAVFGLNALVNLLVSMLLHEDIAYFFYRTKGDVFAGFVINQALLALALFIFYIFSSSKRQSLTR